MVPVGDEDVAGSHDLLQRLEGFGIGPFPEAVRDSLVVPADHERLFGEAAFNQFLRGALADRKRCRK